MRAYDSSLSLEQLQGQARLLDRRRADMNDADRRFTLALAAAGGIYVLQFLDALVYGGGRMQAADLQQASSPAPSSSGLQPLARLDVTHAGIGVCWRF